MSYEMWDYLSVVTPNGPNALVVRPTNTLIETGTKNVVVYHGDGRSIETVILDEDSVFHVTLEWEPISEADSGIIMNFYHSSYKGFGMAKSFKWTNYGEPPESRHTYVVRFASDLSRDVRRGYIYGIKSVRLKILGRA